MRLKAVLFSLCLVLLMAFPIYAAGTATVKQGAIWTTGDIIKKEVIITWVDDTAGTTQTLNMSSKGSGALNLEGWYFYMCTTDPGTPAPSVYNITITDKYGVDKLYGEGASRSATASADMYPAEGTPVVNGPTWTFTLSSNSEAGGTGICACIFSNK